MSKKCPYCKSYNTEAAVDNYVKRGVVNIGRVALVTGVTLVSSFLGPTASKLAGYSTWKNTDPGSFEGHRCCNCGRTF